MNDQNKQDIPATTDRQDGNSDYIHPGFSNPLNPSDKVSTPTHPIGSEINIAEAAPAEFTKKPSKWRHFFIVLGVLQFLGVAFYFIVMMGLMQQARSGVSGTEFVGLLLMFTLVPAVGIVAFLNFVTLPIYMFKQKLKGKGLVLSCVSLAVSTLLVANAAYSAYSMFVVFPDSVNTMNERSRQRVLEHEAERAKASYEISKEQAVTLLQACKLKGFYYTDQSDKTAGGWGELSESGVVVTEVDGAPYRISIADRLIPELVPVAREAQKTCANPQFWHDGEYEQYEDGKWYFKSEVVNATQSGISKDEAITYMQSCKTDYFVGYTDVNLVKDTNTKSWLDKAEKSTTGIEISEGSTSYVFASKSMTQELQDSARLFRSSCYGSKKLYVAIDDWIETEYPLGKWTRVKQ